MTGVQRVLFRSAGSGTVHPRRARLLQPDGWPSGLDAVQLVHGRDVVQQGRVRKGGP